MFQCPVPFSGRMRVPVSTCPFPVQPPILCSRENGLEKVRRAANSKPHASQQHGVLEVATQNGGNMAFRSQHPILLPAQGGVCVVCGHGVDWAGEPSLPVH